MPPRAAALGSSHVSLGTRLIGGDGQVARGGLELRYGWRVAMRWVKAGSPRTGVNPGSIPAAFDTEASGDDG
jgi:hypothetical protein